MVVIGEIGRVINLSNNEGTWAIGTTFSFDQIMSPVDHLTVHASVSRFQAKNTGPGAVAIGVSTFRTASGAVTNFAGSANWSPIAYSAEKIAFFRISMEVVRADVKASWFAQIWR